MNERELVKIYFELTEKQIDELFETGKTVYWEDYSNYSADRCSNGGCYGFWSYLRRIAPYRYRITQHTTADFEYCRACGTFGHSDCGEYEEYDLRSNKKKITALRAKIREYQTYINELEQEIRDLQEPKAEVLAVL